MIVSHCRDPSFHNATQSLSRSAKAIQDIEPSETKLMVIAIGYITCPDHRSNKMLLKQRNIFMLVFTYLIKSFGFVI